MKLEVEGSAAFEHEASIRNVALDAIGVEESDKRLNDIPILSGYRDD